MKTFKQTIKVIGEFEVVVKANSEFEAERIFEDISDNSYATPGTTEHDSWMVHPQIDDYAENYCDFEIESEIEEVKN